MRQIVNVNIAGIAFTLDRECYTILNNFLDRTRQSMFGNADCERIMGDIEASIAEQILSIQSAEMPVSEQVLIPIIESLGGQVSNLRSQTGNTVQTPPVQNITKRLYRNPKGAILGGVCNGMASYFNVDVVIFRILFIIPFFFGGIAMIWRFIDIMHFSSFSINATSILVYIILWIVIPQANTPRQKLEMVGDQVTVDAIAGTAHEPKRSEAGHVFTVILKVIALFFGISLLVGFIVVTCASFIRLSVEMSRVHTPVHDILSVLQLNMGMASLWAASLVLLPAIAIFYLILGSVMNFKSTKFITWSLFILWIVSLLGAFFYVMVNIGELARVANYWN